MVQLNDELIELLDAEAGRRGISRSALIRQALHEALDQSRAAAIDAAILAAYTREPQAAPDEWGELPAELERSSVETMQRLDVEERDGW